MPLLLEHFTAEFAKELPPGADGRPAAPPVFSAAVRDLLAQAEWPGNVRQLRNLVHRLVLLCAGRTVEVEDLPPEMRGRREELLVDAGREEATMDDIKRRYAKLMLERCGGNSFNVALIPGMPNLIVGNEPGQPVKLMIPDPFVRSNSGDQSADPFIADFISRMPAAYAASDIIFTDDWYVYHAALGEVHCGTNVRRTPSNVTWWDAAAHLTN